MLAITTCLWSPNAHSLSSSHCFSEVWVDRLYRAFRRNLTLPFRFIVWTDRRRQFSEPVEQRLLTRMPPDYGSCIEPFAHDGPQVFVGLDTLIIGNIDKMGQWALDHPGELALTKHPYADESINGVVLSGGDNRHIFETWQGQNDMEWLRAFPHRRVDDLWPGRVVSWKATVRDGKAPPGARIIYFHGKPKMHHLRQEPLVKAHWR